MTVGELEARLRAAGACAFGALLGGVVAVRVTFPADPASPPVTYTGEGESIEAAVANALAKAGLR